MSTSFKSVTKHLVPIINQRISAFWRPGISGLLLLSFWSSQANSQHLLDMFEPPQDSWKLVGDVVAKGKELNVTSEGEAILINGTSANSAPYLLSKGAFSDIHVQLEFMIPRDSNSGLYFMGRYEVQIRDSYGKEQASFSDLGGIYERWEEGWLFDHGYEGIAPSSNAAKPPGEWQTLQAIFRAPCFDSSGKKISNALFEEVTVNGSLVQKNQSVTGPTRSAIFQDEAAAGPLVIQGDHGPIAIRSLSITPLPSSRQ